MKSDALIIFIGGVHGVGKTTICSRICQEIGAEHLVASDIIKKVAGKNREVTVDGKRVANVAQNQDLLLIGLSDILVSGKRYLLDGHFTLMSPDNKTRPIPLETFRGIGPKALILLSDEHGAIAIRLLARGGAKFDASLIAEMQEAEISHAKKVAADLNKPLQKIHLSGEEFEIRFADLLGALRKWI